MAKHPRNKKDARIIKKKKTEIFVDKVESIFLEKRLIIEMREASVY